MSSMDQSPRGQQRGRGRGGRDRGGRGGEHRGGFARGRGAGHGGFRGGSAGDGGFRGASSDQRGRSRGAHRSGASPSPSPSPSSPASSSSAAAAEERPNYRERRRAAVYQAPDVYAAIDSAVPRALDVVEFASARSAELSSLVQLLQSKEEGTGGGGRRVFQSLPRHLRRRAQSHNLHRLPYRLRAAAQREMESGMLSEKAAESPSNAEQLTNHRRKRRRPTNALASHAHRQSAHTWLETHIWHSKRMHMVNAWGWRLSRTPTDKSWRAMHKASLHLCTLSDVSYISCLQIDGQEVDVAALLQRVGGGGGTGPMNALYRDGQREGELLLYHPDRHPFGFIAPVKFLWRPRAASSLGSSTEPRALWLWVHAAVYEELLQLLSALASQHHCSVQSLRGELCRFELTGARCQQVLAKVLKVAEGQDGAVVGGKGSDVWKLLCEQTVRVSSSLPSSVVLGVTVVHPATLRGKQRIQQPFIVTPRSSWSTDPLPPESTAPSPALLNLLTRWPASACCSDLWQREAREGMTASSAWGKRKARFAQQMQEKAQRQASAAPEPTGEERKEDANPPADSQQPRSKKRKHSPAPTVPRPKPVQSLLDDLTLPLQVLLIQRPSPASATASSPELSQRHQRGVLAGWDVVLPAGYSKPFLHALHYAGARVEGLTERWARTVEGGGLCFPMDFPDCTAGWMWERWQGEEERAKWRRTPPAKRVNWLKLGVHSPWWPDWEGVLGIERSVSERLGLDAGDMRQVDCSAKGWESIRASDRINELTQPAMEASTTVLASSEDASAPAIESATSADEGAMQDEDDEDEEHNAELIEREQAHSLVPDVATTDSSSSPHSPFVLPYYVLRNSYWRQLQPRLEDLSTPASSSFLSSPAYATALLPVNLHPIHRGTLSHNALIALPNPSHLPSLLHSTPLTDPAELDHVDKLGLYMGSDEPLHRANGDLKPTDAADVAHFILCGFVTSGLWSYLRGEGEGVGLVTARGVAQAMDLARTAGLTGQRCVVMVRNVTSRTWRPMYMRLR